MSVLMRSAAIAAVLHITPAVVLVKRPDAVQALLPGADAYFAREVHLSTPDAHRLHKAVDWSPEDGVLTFYVGRTGSAAVGALEFVRVDTPHGPIEVAVAFFPPPPGRAARPSRPRSRRGSGGNRSARDVPRAVRARRSSGTRRSECPRRRDNGRHRGGAVRWSSGAAVPRPLSGRRRAQRAPSLSLPPQPRAGPTPAPGTTRRAAACS